MKIGVKISTFFKGLFRLKRLAVLTVTLGRDGTDIYTAYTVELKGEQVEMNQHQSALKSIAHFSGQYPNVPVLLCLQGKGVLSKAVNSTEVSHSQTLLQALPGVNTDDFYIQRVTALGSDGNQGTTLDLVRKSTADSLILDLQEKWSPVIGLSLGNAGDLKENAIRLLLDAGAATAESAVLQTQNLELRAKAKLTGLLAVAGAFVLVTLVTNIVLLGHFSSKSEDLRRQRELSGGEVQKYQQIESGLNGMADFIRHSGRTGYPFAWQTDQLMASRPSGIIITEFSINPLKEALQFRGENLKFQNNRILIKGQSEGSREVNDWLQAMRAMNWVESCNLSGYAVSKDSGKGEFEICLQTRNYIRGEERK